MDGIFKRIIFWKLINKFANFQAHFCLTVAIEKRLQLTSTRSRLKTMRSAASLS